MCFVTEKQPISEAHQKQTLYVLAHYMSDKLFEKNKTLRDLKNLFIHLDKHKLGVVDIQEFKTILRIFGIILPSSLSLDKNILNMFYWEELFGIDGKGLFEYQPFIELVEKGEPEPFEKLYEKNYTNYCINSQDSLEMKKSYQTKLNNQNLIKSLQNTITIEEMNKQKLLTILIQKLYEKHTSKLSLTKMFKYVDVDNSSFIDLSEFKRLLNVWGFETNNIQLRELFEVFNPSDDDLISYSNFVNTIEKYQMKHPLEKIR